MRDFPSSNSVFVWNNAPRLASITSRPSTVTNAILLASTVKALLTTASLAVSTTSFTCTLRQMSVLKCALMDFSKTQASISASSVPRTA